MQGLIPSSWTVVILIRKGTGIKCEGNCRSWLPCVQKRLSYFSIVGASGQAGLIRLSPNFLRDTSSGHAFVGVETGCCAWAGNLSLSPFYWAEVGLGTNNAIRLLTAEILMRTSLPTTKVLLSLCLVYSVPSLHLQPAPGYSIVSCLGGNITLGWDRVKKSTKIQWLWTSIYR